MKHETKNKQTNEVGSSEISTADAKVLKQLKMQLERHRRKVAGFRQKIEKEIERLQRQVEKKSRNVQVGAASSPIDSDFQSEIGISNSWHFLLITESPFRQTGKSAFGYEIFL